MGTRRFQVPDEDISTDSVLILETGSGARVHVPLDEGAGAGDELAFELPAQAISALSAADVDDLCAGRIVVSVGVEESDEV